MRVVPEVSGCASASWQMAGYTSLQLCLSACCPFLSPSAVNEVSIESPWFLQLLRVWLVRHPPTAFSLHFLCWKGHAGQLLHLPTHLSSSQPLRDRSRTAPLTLPPPPWSSWPAFGRSNERRSRVSWYAMQRSFFVCVLVFFSYRCPISCESKGRLKEWPTQLWRWHLNAALPKKRAMFSLWRNAFALVDKCKLII